MSLCYRYDSYHTAKQNGLSDHYFPRIARQSKGFGNPWAILGRDSRQGPSSHAIPVGRTRFSE